MANRRYNVALAPKKIPALITVPTGEVINIDGKIYTLLKLVRAAKYE